MKRLVRTSRGWVELEIDEVQIAGFHMRVVVFGDGGWATADRTWNAKWPVAEKSLETFLTDIAVIPPGEARQIAEESVREWRERGGEYADRGEKRKVIGLLATTFGLAGLGAIALVAIVVFLALKVA